MRKSLYIFGQLNDGDVQWLAQNGARKTLMNGDEVIREGVPIDALFFILEGTLVVTLADQQRVASLGAGDIIGEISFIDSAPPSATVTAERNAVIFSIPKDTLQSRMESNALFAARFYKAIAVFMADRLRTTTRRLGYGKVGDLSSEAPLEDELGSEILDRVAEAGERFNRLLAAIAAP
jgi:CRP-like cAMP-binding protein